MKNAITSEETDTINNSILKLYHVLERKTVKIIYFKKHQQHCMTTMMKSISESFRANATKIPEIGCCHLLLSCMLRYQIYTICVCVFCLQSGSENPLMNDISNKSQCLPTCCTLTIHCIYVLILVIQSLHYREQLHTGDIID